MNDLSRRMFLKTTAVMAGTAGLISCRVSNLTPQPANNKPNILWIVADDLGVDLGCYGTNEVYSPNIDRLAKEGTLYTNFFTVTAVCSPSRSAMITGMYQTTLGAHNHRSQKRTGKGSGNQAYYNSYELPVKSVPELFREATNLPINTVDDPLFCVVLGTGKILDSVTAYEDVIMHSSKD